MSQTLPKDVPQTLRRWKRYPAYKDSGVEWLGEIPEHWKVIRLRRRCQLQQGLQIAQNERFSEPGNNRFEYITIKSINAGSTHVNNKEYIEKPPSSVICTPDDILLARTGATGEVISGQFGVFHNNFFKVNYNQKKILKNYLIYYLKSSQIKEHLLLLAGTTTIPDLNHGEFLDTPFFEPSIDEQKAIASFLDRETAKIDALIAKKERLIELLQEKRTAIISHAVTKGLDPTVPLKDSGVDWLGKIPTHWEVRKIKKLCSVVKDGLHETPPKVPEGIPFISTQHVRNRYIDLERATFISKDDYEKGHPRIAPSPGDVLITLVGSIGFAAILKPEFYPISFTRHVGYVRPKSNLTANYLLNYVESGPFRTFLDLEVSQTAQPSIYLRSLAEHVIPVPPVDEQNYIVTHLDRETAKIDALIAKIHEGIEKLKEYRTALISAAVTGKIDVRNEVA